MTDEESMRVYAERSERLDTTEPKTEDENCGDNTSEVNTVGYFIYIGRTSCKVFEVDKKDGSQLKESNISVRYDDRDRYEVLDDYLENMTEKIKSIKPQLKKSSFVKTYADPNFSELFESPRRKSEFWYDFNKATNLCFNILDWEQVAQNLGYKFSALGDQDIVVNIGRGYIDIYKKSENRKSFDPISIDFGIGKVEGFITEKAFDESWDDDKIKEIKEFIKKEIGSKIDFTAENAYILKDEITFMKDMGYPLRKDSHKNECLAMSSYRRTNKEKLYSVDFLSMLNEKCSNESEKKYKHGFKIGHIILEALFDEIKIKKVYPSNYHCIHGDVNAYVFNVVVGGSASSDHKDNMKKAIEFLSEKMGVTVTSPRLEHGEIQKHTTDTDIEHAIALEECDLLFVSNGGDEAYFGPTTAMQIYAARLLHKPIAFWKEPKSENLREYNLQFIPYECWEDEMDTLKRK